MKYCIHILSNIKGLSVGDAASLNAASPAEDNAVVIYHKVQYLDFFLQKNMQANEGSKKTHTTCPDESPPTFL